MSTNTVRRIIRDHIVPAGFSLSLVLVALGVLS